MWLQSELNGNLLNSYWMSNTASQLNTKYIVKYNLNFEVFLKDTTGKYDTGTYSLQ